jgi:Bacterial Ig-like domain
MRTSFEKTSLLTIILLATLVLPPGLRAQVTNWVAYNDHRPSTVPVNWAITAPRVSGYNMGAPADLAPSPLTNFLTGNPLTATISATRTGVPDDHGTVGRPLLTNTPMARIFYGICDLSNDGIVGVRAVDAVPANTVDSFVTLTFGGLNPAKRYVFRGGTARNGGYGTRWSVATISADGWTDAHINGNGGPGVLTAANFPAAGTNLMAGQAAFNSGANNEGAVVGWNDIVPFADGTFSIICKQYTKQIPGGTATGNAPYGYGFGASMLAEVEIVAPTITANPPALTMVEQNRPFSLSVAATGVPLNYQCYKQGAGAIAGATFPTYSVAQAQLSDSGMYYAVVYNSLASRTSTVAQVSVFADTNAPSVGAIFSYPSVDASGLVATLNQIIIEFSEPVTPASVSSPASYTITPGGGHPASVIVTNERSVVLMLGSPLAENTDYSVTLSGARDTVGNVAGSSSAPFHSWVSGIGNGLLMESYNVEDPSILPESVLADPDYPNNPFRRDTLRAFDSRLVFPDDTREGYGARIRGVFIPPVSGDWKFFARTRNLGVLFLNPNGTDEAGKMEILRQSTENAPFNWDRLQSSLFALRAGRAYYIEGLYKGGIGAGTPGYLKVAARLAGTDVPMPVDFDNLMVDSNSLAGAAIAYPLAPHDLGGALTIQQDVADRNVEENNLATFSIQASNPSGLPLQYQWFRGGSPIAGANFPTYTLQPTIAADNGATFSVQVAKVGSVVTSRTATLTVRPDITPPRVLEVRSSYTNLSVLVIRFNELVTSGTAQDAFNFKITGGPDLAGDPTLGADGMTVTVLLASPLTVSASYELSVLSITDLAGNTIDPNPTSLTFTAGSDLPRLSIALSDIYVVVSWPAPSTGFVLEETTTLADPPSSTVWTPVVATPVVVGGQNTVTLDIAGSRIFRLRQ